MQLPFELIRVSVCISFFSLTSAIVFAGQSDPATDFAHEIVPILQKHCVSCHGGREAKGSFSLNTRELLVDSGHVQVGRPDESQIIDRVLASDKHVQMPPPEKARLTAAEVSSLQRWVADGLPWDEGFSFGQEAYEPPLLPRRPTLPPAVDGRKNPIDRILDADLAAHEIPRPAAIDDNVFLRRASLDLIGLLPEPEALAAFLADPAKDKRENAIRRLLDRRIDYADHWLTFFNDLLRNDYSGTGFITGGRQQVSTWLYAALLNNKPFDEFARELIAPVTPASQGYIDGIRWRGEVSAGQTVEIQFAQSVSQSFLGINLKCASCHDSFIDRWKLDEAYNLAAVYSSRPLEIHRCDKPVGKIAEAKWLFPELGAINPDASKEERLRQLAALMTHPDNGRFTRTIVNRLWYKMMGRGIVHPLDAMQTKPWNEDLLDMLATHLQDNKYDLKAVLYLIATSQAYQSRCAVRQSPPENATDGFVYRGPLARRMTAEQFLDAVWQMTGSAPTTFDAPVARAIVPAAEAEKFQLSGVWIWGDSAANGNVPPAGESLSLRRKFTLADEVTSGGGIITCDNSFVLYVNGRKIDNGDDWNKPHAILLRSALKKGNNEIVVVATNAGSTANAAGLFFDARLKLKNGEDVTIASDAAWEWNPTLPAMREGRMGAIPGEWKPVVIVPALAAWTDALNSDGKHLLLQSMNNDPKMTRASLLKSDFLMRSLGRPMREQIVSMRPSEVTTLEAVDLMNGSTLADYLAAGAHRLATKYPDDRSGLIDFLMRFALSREPDPQETILLEDALSVSPAPQEIEDVLWSIFMMPEFMLIR
ncbi:MAG: DUF1549 domain-containing protein [Planctomycetaceae bacterium]|nr:DUF1549 domain-containing protein [Planctomycetaceae bacterium]